LTGDRSGGRPTDTCRAEALADAGTSKRPGKPEELAADATGRALRRAAEILAAGTGIGLELRTGVHAGEAEARGDDIAGLAVTKSPSGSATWRRPVRSS
jgi:hypothetical protein